MKQLLATIIVLEHEVNVLRGLRLSRDMEVAAVAVKRERELTNDLNRLRAERDSRQPDLIPHPQAA